MWGRENRRTVVGDEDAMAPASKGERKVKKGGGDMPPTTDDCELELALNQSRWVFCKNQSVGPYADLSIMRDRGSVMACVQEDLGLGVTWHVFGTYSSLSLSPSSPWDCHMFKAGRTAVSPIGSSWGLPQAGPDIALGPSRATGPRASPDSGLGPDHHP